MACQAFPPFPYLVCGLILDKYNSMGGPNSFLLYPKSNELTNPGNTGKRSEFLGGNIYWSAATGAHPVAHDFLTKWGNYGYESGFMGYPTTDEIVLADNIGRRQEFQGSSIYWSPLSGAHNIQGLIRQKWVDLGAQAGALGYPTTDEVITPDSIGRFNRFQNGMIYWSPTTGAHAITGRILTFWELAGHEASPYGYPTSDATPVTGEPGALVQQFQHGSIYTRPDGYLRGLTNASSPSFTSYDTGLHPGYPAVDLSNYDTLADPTGTMTQQNLVDKTAVRQYFIQRDRPTAADLWDHYYGNTGYDYVLDATKIDSWTAETTTDYPGPSIPPAVTVDANREDAILQAMVAADSTGQPAKVVVSTPWRHSTAGISNDHVQSLGRYALNSTTAVIAHPGNPGNHQIQLRQETHIYDVYDFDANSGEDFEPANYGAAIAATGEALGIAKPFLVYGSGTEKSWSGVR